MAFPQPASYESKLKEFDNVPLFMRSLPEGESDDVAIAALQNLVHDGTPDEIAQNFKEQGNDYFRGKRYREALGFYTQGIEVKPTDPILTEALLCNRAACNLELKNFGSVLRDASKALILNPRSSKAYYRSSLALLALDRPDEALDCCLRCLAFDNENLGIKHVQTRATQLKEANERKRQEKELELKQKKSFQRKLGLALQSRNVIVIRDSQSSTAEIHPHQPHFSDEDPEELVLPVFFLYPQYATSDLVSHFAENTTFLAILSSMFPPDGGRPTWDEVGEYTLDNLVVYAVTRNKRLLKVGKNLTLRDVCAKAGTKEGNDGLEVKGGCLSFFVLPNGLRASAWVEEFKQNRDSP